MIQIKNLVKHFGKICAVNHVTLSIPEGTMYGLLGTNGAGKSTLLRLITGILEPDEGTVEIDGQTCYDNPACKEQFFYLSDTPYYFPNATLAEMADFYRKQYEKMEIESVRYMAEMLNLDMRQPLRTFSKGMKRQAFLILALCANTKYLLCDEVFDGLDVIVTDVMKQLLRKEIEERKLTVVVVSHKLRDLEDICGQIGILHKGGIVSAGAMKARASNIYKLQCVFREDTVWEEAEHLLLEKPEVVRCQKDGAFVTMIINETEEPKTAEEKTAEEKTAEEKTEEKTEEPKEEQKDEPEAGHKTTEWVRREFTPVFCKEVPMTLEETFIAEMEENGYDIRKVLY